MNRIETYAVLIDREIDMLISMKNLIDIRLSELYVQREDAVTEWYHQNEKEEKKYGNLQIRKR